MLLRADSLASTHAIAAAIARLARPGDIIVLAGEMGAGKTAFAQGFGRALGITEAITSPTFTLVHSHPVPGTKLTLHHADLYRLDSTFDVDDLALHELAEFGGIVRPLGHGGCAQRALHRSRRHRRRGLRRRRLELLVALEQRKKTHDPELPNHLAPAVAMRRPALHSKAIELTTSKGTLRTPGGTSETDMLVWPPCRIRAPSSGTSPGRSCVFTGGCAVR